MKVKSYAERPSMEGGQTALVSGDSTLWPLTRLWWPKVGQKRQHPHTLRLQFVFGTPPGCRLVHDFEFSFHVSSPSDQVLFLALAFGS